MTTIKRVDPSQFGVMEGSGISQQEASDHDFDIRSGNCPNGCGKMEVTVEPYVGQECPGCKFWCNTLPEISQ